MTKKGKSTFFGNLPGQSIQIFEPGFSTPQISNQIDAADTVDDIGTIYISVYTQCTKTSLRCLSL